MSRYFLRQFIIYTLLFSGLLFIQLNKAFNNLNGEEPKSTVKFVYEAF